MSEQTTRIVYRLTRRCQPCHDGDHTACEGTLYACPRERQAPCECACTCPEALTLAQTWINPHLITSDDPRHFGVANRSQAAGHAGGLKTLQRHGRGHFARLSRMAHVARYGGTRTGGDAA